MENGQQGPLHAESRENDTGRIIWMQINDKTKQIYVTADAASSKRSTALPQKSWLHDHTYGMWIREKKKIGNTTVLVLNLVGRGQTIAFKRDLTQGFY